MLRTVVCRLVRFTRLKMHIVLPVSIVRNLLMMLMEDNLKYNLLKIIHFKQTDNKNMSTLRKNKLEIDP